MVYLHMSLTSIRMMDTFTRMIRRNFSLEEHRFLYWDRLTGDDRKLLDYGNSVEILGSEQEQKRQLCEEMDRADVIIWHGIMFGAKRCLFLLQHKKYLKKSVWVMRGIDLYNWKKEGSGLKNWLINKINYQCRKEIPNVAAIFRTDEEVYREQFGETANVFYLPYPIAESAFDLMESFKGSAPRKNGKLHIQVAHNAYTFNKHLEILERIKKFQSENLRVVIPLSYGHEWHTQTGNYFRTVSDTAKRYFGEKTIILKRLMPADEYSELLCNIDVSVYGAARQNALGNILRSLYIGNKVFLAKDNPLYSFFKERGIDVYETESIDTLSYEEFSAPSNSENAVDWIRRNYYPDASAFYWKAMFDSFVDGAEKTTEEEINKQISSVLDRDFSTLEHKHYEKRNYINLDRYIEHPKGTVYAQIKDVVIIGVGPMGMEIFQQFRQSNQQKTKWSIEGFVDFHTKTLLDPKTAYDVIGTPDEIEIKEDVLYFNTIDNVQYRQRAAEHVLANGGQLQRYVSKDTHLSSGIDLEEGCSFFGKCTVLRGASFGCCTIVKSSFVDYGAQIGAYCTLECGSWIGEGAVIEDNVIIGARAQIAPGVRISKGKVIPSFSMITEDVL